MQWQKKLGKTIVRENVMFNSSSILVTGGSYYDQIVLRHSLLKSISVEPVKKQMRLTIARKNHLIFGNSYHDQYDHGLILR